MTDLNLTGEADLHGRQHYRIRVGKKLVAYCYIRKNACTSFKKFFLSQSVHQKRPGEQDLAFMSRCHRIKPAEMAAADYRVVVLREPLERSVSLYKNKFIQRNGNADIFQSYAETTGQDPRQASFRDFVTTYLTLELSRLDAHVWTQRSHLLPVPYTHAIPMAELGQRMAGIVGPELAQEFFCKPVNASKSKAGLSEDVSDLPSETLHRLYVERQELPKTASFLPADLAGMLADVYREDATLLTRIA